MSCSSTIHLICDYLEGRLSPSIEREVSQHLALCGNCRRVLDAAENTLETDFGTDPRSLPHAHHA
ncbi:MAG TPA: zf-HC2 domain-containing protein [Candidatus Acidoferrales bacterium]|nr:zf-HC2 domain-containing protein [Candidatus Acidoferrales bacterium]